MDCPLNETKWKERSLKFGCQDIDVYHCLLLQNKTETKEVCMERSLIAQGQCPILTHTGYLHWTECNTSECPDTFYQSDEVYKYPICLQKTISTPISSLDDRTLSTGFVVSIPLLVLVLVVIFVLLYWRRRRHSNSRDQNTIIEEMPLREVDNNAAVESMMPELLKHKIYLVSGKLGNGVSTTAKTAIQRFKLQQPEWKHHYLNYRDILSSPFSEKTIIFVDGWFGLWNANPCEEGDVRQSLETLQRQLQNLEQFMVVLGMRGDIYEQYKKIFQELFPELHECRLDLDISRVRRADELGSHFETVFSSGDCKKRNCGCKTLNVDRITSKSEKVGHHLVIDMLAKIHQIIPKYMECRDLLESLVCHFDALWKKKRRLTECLMYIVIQGKYKQDDIVNIEVKNSFLFSITADSFQNCKSLRKYIKHMQGTHLVNVHGEDVSHEPESVYLVFHHVILYLAAFHSLFKRYPTETMKHCSIDAILQIVRPEGTGGDEDLIKFCVKADNETVKFFYKEVVKQKPGLEDKLKHHPLVKHAAGTEV